MSLTKNTLLKEFFRVNFVKNVSLAQRVFYKLSSKNVRDETTYCFIAMRPHRHESCSRQRRNQFAHYSKLFVHLLRHFAARFRPRRPRCALIAPDTRLRRKSRPFASLMQIKIVPEMSLRNGSRRALSRGGGWRRGGGEWKGAEEVGKGKGETQGVIRFSSCQRSTRYSRRLRSPRRRLRATPRNISATGYKLRRLSRYPLQRPRRFRKRARHDDRMCVSPRIPRCISSKALRAREKCRGEKNICTELYLKKKKREARNARCARESCAEDLFIPAFPIIN